MIMTIFLCLGSPKKKTRTSYVTVFDDDEEDVVTGKIYVKQMGMTKRLIGHGEYLYAQIYIYIYQTV